MKKPEAHLQKRKDPVNLFAEKLPSSNGTPKSPRGHLQRLEAHLQRLVTLLQKPHFALERGKRPLLKPRLAARTYRRHPGPRAAALGSHGEELRTMRGAYRSE